MTSFTWINIKTAHDEQTAESCKIHLKTKCTNDPNESFKKKQTPDFDLLISLTNMTPLEEVEKWLLCLLQIGLETR